MDYIIIYTENKNAYARIWSDWILKISIPKRLKWNKNFENKILEKWKILLIKSKKYKKIEYFWEDYVMLFWEKIENADFVNLKPKERNIILKKILFEHSLPFFEKYSNLLWKKIKEVKIKDLKSKWWSCSFDQKIVLNLKLVHIDKKFLEYVIIHECCHLVEKNHSKNFWQLVSNFMPNYKEIRNQMKKYKF